MSAPDDAAQAIAANLDTLRRRIADAAVRSKRSPSSIALVAVSKTFGVDAVRAAAAAGQRVFGENRVQEAVDKRAACLDLDLEWHLIGHLQSNKARKAAEAFSWIQSIDSVELVSKLDAAATERASRPRVLIEVDLALEQTKTGAQASTVPGLVAAILNSRSLDLRGLMIVPPIPSRPEDSRPWFRRLRELRDELVSTGVPAEHLAELSMGMSHDFEIAVEEGATMVRIGTAIFGGRLATA